MTSKPDTGMMARALDLARGSIHGARPNPAVGCVITRGGEVIAEGATAHWGGPHAEIVALEQCDDPAGATVYVSLEPCAHQGKTGPCADALVAAGVAEVFVAARDPNPAAREGLEKLRAAGIRVEAGLLEEEAEAVNRGFFQRMRTGKPRVCLKLAASLDGRTALADGESQWITGPAARADVQELRARSDAIITGIGTVLADDPALTVRAVAGSVAGSAAKVPGLDIRFQPLRVVVDSTLRTPHPAKLLRQAGSVLVAHAGSADAAENWRKGVAPAAQEDGPGAGLLHPAAPESKVEMLALPGGDGGVDLGRLLEELGARPVNDVLVECGPRLAGAFLDAGLVDELIVYMAPTLLGADARPLMELTVDSMSARRNLVLTDIRRLGEDVRWTLCPA